MDDKRRINPILLKIGLFAGLAILIAVSAAIYREVSQKRQIQSQIDQLKAEADQISKDNSSLQDKIGYFASKDYAEVQGKDKLDMQNPGEQVVVVQPSVAKVATPAASAVPASPVPAVRIASDVPIRIKWWNYFFKY